MLLRAEIEFEDTSQRQTSTRIQCGALTPITDDVTAEAGQMNSDLVLTTGFQTLGLHGLGEQHQNCGELLVTVDL